jgi:hypothetical protein
MPVFYMLFLWLVAQFEFFCCVGEDLPFAEAMLSATARRRISPVSLSLQKPKTWVPLLLLYTFV